MTTTKREVGTSMKEKKGPSPANSKPSPRKHSASVSGSDEKQVPSYLKPTKKSRTDVAPKTLKKPAKEDASQNPTVLRRRSFDRPTATARANNALISPVRPKMAAGATSSSPSVTLKPAAAPKAPLERVAKKLNVPTKPHAQTLSSSRSSHKSPPTTSTKTRRGSSTPPLASRKPPSSPERKEVMSFGAEHENKENLDIQVEPEAEEVVKDDQGEGGDTETPKGDQGEVHDTKTPKAEECGNTETEAVAVYEDTTRVTSVVDKGGQDTIDISSSASEQQSETGISSLVSEQQINMSRAISEQQNEPESESRLQLQTEKVEDEVEEVKSDHIPQPDDGYKENQSQEEIIVGDDPQQEKTPHKDREANPEIEHATKETEEQKQPESWQEEDNEGSQQQGLQTSNEETVQESDAEVEVEKKAEAEAEAEQKAEPEAEIEEEVEPKAEPEAGAEEKVEAKAASETEVKVEVKIEAETEAKAKAKAEVKVEAKTEVKVESETKATNVISKSQVQGKKEPAKPYNNLIKETANRLVKERRNRVLALVGAFENVIDKESTRAK